MGVPDVDLLDELELVFVAVRPDLSDAWAEITADLPNALVHTGSISEVAADAVVSPANSFGFMDGGIDAHYLDLYGDHVGAEVRRAILTRHHGELLVGTADVVATGSARHPWLIAAPTMRVPMRLPADTINPFLAMRAVLLLWRDGVIRAAGGSAIPVKEAIRRIAVPGLGTGVGGVAAKICARQVRHAIDLVRAPDPPPASSQAALFDHQMLYRLDQ